jgi:hypothetical protein
MRSPRADRRLASRMERAGIAIPENSYIKIHF